MHPPTDLCQFVLELYLLMLPKGEKETFSPIQNGLLVVLKAA